MGLEAFFLGLSSGAICLAYCAPVLVPCMMGGMGVCGLRSDSMAVLRFLIGRLLGYLLFAVLAWYLGRSLTRMDPFQEVFLGGGYLVLSLLLVPYALFDRKTSCARSPITAVAKSMTSPIFLPVAAGLASGLNFCPPFLLAMVAGARAGTLQGSLFFFFAFFLGTSVFFIPFPFLGMLRRFPAVRTIGKMAAGIIGLYYAYLGLTILIGGVIAL